MPRPTPIKLGIALLCASVLINAVASMLQMSPHPSTLLALVFSRHGPGLIGAILWPSVLPTFLIVMIWYKQNWARFVMLAVAVVGLISMLVLLFLPPPLQLNYLFLGLGLLVQGLGLGFLFLPTAAPWFKKYVAT